MTKRILERDKLGLKTTKISIDSLYIVKIAQNESLVVTIVRLCVPELGCLIIVTVAFKVLLLVQKMRSIIIAIRNIICQNAQVRIYCQYESVQSTSSCLWSKERPLIYLF